MAKQVKSLNINDSVALESDLGPKLNQSAAAPEFSAAQDYPAGYHVTREGNLYRFTSAHAAGAWTGNDVVLEDMTTPDAMLDVTSAGKLRVVAADGTIVWAESAAPVDSVNGKTGTVVLDASDVGAAVYQQIGIPEFESTATYAVGKLVMYSNAVWKCKTAIATAGAWDASKWNKILELSETNSIFPNAVTIGSRGSGTVGVRSIAIGDGNVASGINSFAAGHGCTAINLYSHAEGEGTTASGDYSHAEGYNTTASLSCAHAEGYTTAAKAPSSHAEGSNTSAEYPGSHAEGYYTIVHGSYAHAEGEYTYAYAEAAHAEGNGTYADAEAAHAEGNGTYAGAEAAHAEGNGTIATGQGSHAEGEGTTASGDYSHAEGSGTTASGSYSHAEGASTTASGLYSHAEGNGTTAQNDYEHAQGRYNASHKANTTWSSSGNTLSSIGFGTSNSARKNAVETMQDGKTFIYGLGNYNGTNTTGSGVLDLASVVNAKAEAADLRYAITTKTPTVSSGTASISLDDRTCNVSETTASVVELTFPVGTTGHARDFLLLLDTTESASAPTLAYASFMTVVADEDMDLTPEVGLNLYTFTEVGVNTFAATRTTLVTIAEKVPQSSEDLLTAAQQAGYPTTGVTNAGQLATALGLPENSTFADCVNKVMLG